jgi:hypothetical protein
MICEIALCACVWKDLYVCLYEEQRAMYKDRGALRLISVRLEEAALLARGRGACASPHTPGAAAALENSPSHPH